MTETRKSIEDVESETEDMKYEIWDETRKDFSVSALLPEIDWCMDGIECSI